MTNTEKRVNSAINDIAIAVGLEPKYDIRNNYSNGLPTKKTTMETVNSIYEDMAFTLPDDGLQDKFNVFNRMVFDLINAIYNEYGFGYDKYMSFMPTMDVYEITKHPKVLAVKQKMRENPSPRTVKNVYAVLQETIEKDIPDSNQIRTGYLTGAFNRKQGDQCLGLRGFGNDIKGNIFTTVIEESYAEGYKNLVSDAIDSRGAVTALYYSSQSIKDAESFAKATQIISEYVQELVLGDCGAQDGIKRYVRPPGLNEHGDDYKGDLVHLLGQQYKLTEEDHWKLITKKDTHLFGKTIIVRTTLSCTLKDNKKVCMSCFGRHGYTKNKRFNLGQWSCTKVNEPAVQSLLSAKHFIVSADGGVYVLDTKLAKYIKVSDNTLSFTRFISKYHKVVMHVPVRESYGLKDLMSISDVIKVSPERVTNIKKITLSLFDKNGKEETLELKIGLANKAGVFTSDFLKFIVENGKSMGKDTYDIDITKWNYRTPFILIPNHVFNYNQLVSNLESLLGSSKSLNGDKIESVERLVNEVFDLYNTKLSLHISHLATVIYGLGAKDPLKVNYMMNRGLDTPLGTIKTITKNRGFASLASTGTIQNMLSIHNIESEHKEPHNLDVLIDPQGFLDAYGG